MQKYLYLSFLLFATLGASAQQMPERKQVRKGNRAYHKGEYQQSIERYGRALTIDPESFEATYNLGNALYKAEMFDRSEQTLQKAAADSLRTDEERAQAFYNLGNAQFKQQKYREALESYKQSLRLNPADRETKYNYAYTKRLLDENENNGGGGDQDQNQNQDQQGENQPQNGDGQDRQGKQEQQPDDPQNGSDQSDEQQPSEQQPGESDPSEENPDGKEGAQPQPQPGIPEQEQEQMLDAIQAQEDKTQDKLKEKRGVIVRSKKNW